MALKKRSIVLLCLHWCPSTYEVPGLLLRNSSYVAVKYIFLRCMDSNRNSIQITQHCQSCKLACLDLAVAMCDPL